MREAQVHAIANPLINITLQGRHDTDPKRRGMTRVPELMAAGVNVAFGHDCVMDPWYSLGSADMLEVAAMGLHVAQMTGQDGMRACFAAVTANAAQIFCRGNRTSCKLSGRQLALSAGVRRFVFTSTTSLYGHGRPWVDADTSPQRRTIITTPSSRRCRVRRLVTRKK